MEFGFQRFKNDLIFTILLATASFAHAGAQIPSAPREVAPPTGVPVSINPSASAPAEVRGSTSTAGTSSSKIYLFVQNLVSIGIYDINVSETSSDLRILKDLNRITISNYSFPLNDYKAVADLVKRVLLATQIISEIDILHSYVHYTPIFDIRD